ncbi:hypothetical protein SSX86_015609 [Deinandra increscens subsp. villosa]|uniref:TF-B3 domain-containing protein n=1 Tax=Deinandra increscens subsp. villosa TaxID=3103831 RepID=A0AAP0GXB4_9ASTR
MASTSSGGPKVCFNSTCNQLLVVPRHGWLRRTGDFADLCDRCCSAFEDGKFCDTFHLNASGWRCCESCGKQIHCGCIVSFHMFILLDAGGIECLKCAKTEYILVCTVAYELYLLILTPNPTWPCASHSLRGPAERISDFSSKRPRIYYWIKSCTMAASTHTRDDSSERFVNGSWRVSAQEKIGDKALTSGIQYDEQHNLFKDVSYQSHFHTNATPLSSLPATFAPHDKKMETGNVSGIHVKRLRAPPSVGKLSSNNNGAGPSLENQAHNTKAQGETRSCHQILQRYWSQFTGHERQQLSGGSHAKITPLFEKVLTASDAGKIGRLVLPKKYAEAYLPPISQPEGCPLVVQDLNGKDWVLQYRFWPNNNSKMYVLEGITPFLQSMQLRAGDTVTFSRLEPEGKLVMGFRKVSPAFPYDKGNETTDMRIPAHEESLKDDIALKSRNIDGTWSEVDKNSIRAKRKKGGKMCSNSKNLKLNEEQILQFSVTLEQIQGLLRPPLTNSPTIVVIEGVEFEDFQEAPIIGSPTALLTDNVDGSLCSTMAEPTPDHLERMLPMINHENQKSLKTIEGLDALADLAVHDGIHNGTKHKSNHSTPTPITHHDPTPREQQVGKSMHKRNPFILADAMRSFQMLYGNENQKEGPDLPDLSREKPSDSTFKNQNIDLNIQPEREEELYPVSDSMGIMRLVEESTQRYMKQQQQQQKLSFNGITDGAHKNHDL